MSPEFHIFNGALKKSSEKVLSISNRAFLYGDGFFETMFAYNNNVLFLRSHLSRIEKAMKIFQYIPFDLFKDIEELRSLIIYLARKNKLYKAFRIRLSIFRNTGGYYKPTDNSISYSIQTTHLSYDKFFMNKEGLTVDVYKEFRKDYSPLSEFKTCNSLIYILASKFALANQLDDVLLLNSKDKLVESTNANVFFVVDNKIYTPKIEDGCIAGIMRHLIIYTLNDLGIEVEEKSLSEDILKQSDEIFLTNSVSGIKFVSSLGIKRYINFTSKRLLSDFAEKNFIY